MNRWTFDHVQLPVATAMVSLAEATRDPLPCYMCYWSAFNNIYRAIADAEIQGLPKYQTNADGTMKFVQRDPGDSVNIPRVITASESRQITHARLGFSDELKHRLISHNGTNYFVNRVPRFSDEPIERDIFGQELNGVINVGRTISREYPVWSPINKVLYRQYMDGDRSQETADILVRQIVNLLYTVRNNLFHGGKRFDDASDREVLEHALPLLTMIVESFMRRD
jgi:hypothetical protein